MTADTPPPNYAAVPELTDALHLEIVQNQIEASQIELAKHERLLKALPSKDNARGQLRASVERTREILGNYREQEAELIARLMGGAAE